MLVRQSTQVPKTSNSSARMRSHTDASWRNSSPRLSLEQKVRLLTGADFWALHDEPADRPAARS